MTTEQTSHHTLDHLRKLSSELTSYGHGAHGIAADVEQLIRERDEARAENERTARERVEFFQEGLRLKRKLKESRTSVPRVITPDELREGQVVVVWAVGCAPDPAGEVIQIRSIEHASDGTINLRAPGQLCIFNPHDEQAVLLADAPAPDPEPEPWKPQGGDVGIVTHFQGEELDEPVGAWFTGLSWYRLDRRNWPDLAPIARPSEVTVVRAKVVPDE